MLLFARFENQKQNIESETVFINALILDCLSRSTEEAKAKNITITILFEEDFYLFEKETKQFPKALWS